MLGTFTLIFTFLYFHFIWVRHLKMCNKPIQILYSLNSSSCHHNVTEHMPGDCKLACINKQKSLYNLHIHYWVIQYEQIHFHPSLFILYPKRTVDGFVCSWNVALKLFGGQSVYFDWSHCPSVIWNFFEIDLVFGQIHQWFTNQFLYCSTSTVLQLVGQLFEIN